MKKKKNIIIGILCAMLVLMGAGYAFFTAQLNIASTGTIKGNFKVVMTEVTPTAVCPASVDQITSACGTADGTLNSGIFVYNPGVTTVTLDTSLMKPNDVVVYTIKVENQGNIAARYKEINNYASDAHVEIETDIDDTTNAPIDIIQPGEYDTFTVTVRLKDLNNTEFNASKAPTTHSWTLSPVFEQVTSGGETPSVDPTPSDDEDTPVLKIKKTAAGTTMDQAVATYGVSNLSQGDLLEFGTEQFYVLETSGNNIKMLSRYLINVGDHKKAGTTEGLQDANIGGTIGRSTEDMMAEYQQGYLSGSLPFSSTAYWWDDGNNTYASGYSENSFAYNSSSTLYNYINTYVQTLSTMGLNATSGTALSIQELGSICNADFTESTSDKSGCPNFIFETTYWLGSIGTNTNVWFATMSNQITTGNYSSRGGENGLRPVINVTLS